MIDETIFDEQRQQRDHEHRMAKIAQLAKAERRPFVGGVLFGLLCLIVIAGITVAIVWNVRDDRANKLRIERERAKVAERCIESGYIWINNNCIPAKIEQR